MYVQCAEHAELHSADVTYCLCFSIIMLNTDLHNQNMKDEARMTLDDYIKFNTTYGEMNRDCPLPAALLTSIYRSILAEQLLIVDDVRFFFPVSTPAAERKHHHAPQMGRFRRPQPRLLPAQRPLPRPLPLRAPSVPPFPRFHDSMHAELLKATSPLLLQTLQTLLQRSASALWVSTALRMARSLLRAAAHAQNNLLVDSVVQLLVDRTRLPVRPARFHALITAEPARPVGDLCFVRAEGAETRGGAGKRVVWLEYSPLRNVREFGRGASEDAEKGGVCVGVECYRTLLEMIRENGGSIQKGYSDVVMMSDRGLILVLDGVGGVFYGNGERGEGDLGSFRGARERNLDVAQRNESDVQRARRRARAPPGRSGRGEESRQCGDADEMRGRFGRSVMTT